MNPDGNVRIELRLTCSGGIDLSNKIVIPASFSDFFLAYVVYDRSALTVARLEYKSPPRLRAFSVKRGRRA